MGNRYILVPFVVWAIAQFLKFVIAAFQGRVDIKYLYGSGGMPSVHSAVVTALATTALLNDGLDSALFGITVIFAAIVMYDSFGVRRSSGEQAVVINAILESLGHDKPVHANLPHTRLRELLGHKPLEVLVGALLGIALGCLFNYDHLQALGDIATTPATFGYMIALVVISAFMIVGGTALRLTWMRKYRQLQPVKQVIARGSWSSWLVGITGLILAGLQYENIAVTNWLLWPALLVVLYALGLTVGLRGPRKQLTSALADAMEQTAKAKWFEGPNKKRQAKAERGKKRK